MAEDKLYRLVNSLSAQVRIIEKTLCAGGNGSNRIPGSYGASGLLCDNSINTEYTDGVYQTIPHPDYVQKVQLCASDKKDVEVVCISNDGGNTIVTGWEVFDTSVTPPVSKIYFNGIDVTGTYVVVPCGNNVTYDYEKVTVCVDGQSWTKVLIFNTTSQPILVNIMWLDNLDNVVPAPDITLIDNINCGNEICNPMITWSYGDNLSTLLSGHNFTVTKPSCCSFVLNTSIGDIPVIGDFTFLTTETFKCTFTINSITSINNCDLSKVVIIGNKLQ